MLAPHVPTLIEDRLRADLEAARGEFEIAILRRKRAVGHVWDPGVGSEDSLSAVSVNREYMRAFARYREALGLWNKFVIHRPVPPDMPKVRDTWL